MPDLAPETRVGPVELTVADLDRSLDYYRSAVGPRRAGALAGARRARPRAARGHVRPPRERGDLPARSRLARDRDLPRPAAAGMAARGRRDPDGHAAARHRGPALLD